MFIGCSLRIAARFRTSATPLLMDFTNCDNLCFQMLMGPKTVAEHCNAPFKFWDLLFIMSQY